MFFTPAARRPPSPWTESFAFITLFSKTNFTKKDAANFLEITESGAYKLLERMKELGLLNSRKSGKKWLYTVT